MENFKAMMRMRENLEESDEKFTYYMMSGTVFANIPGKPLKKLFRFIGANKARSTKKESNKYLINSQEVLFFEDPDSGEVVNIWDNPFTGEQNEVFHTYNNPVNIPLLSAYIPPPTKLYDDKLAVFIQTVPLRYPNPLSPEVYPNYSTGNFYIASESFVNSSWISDAYDEAKSSVPGLMFWTRSCPWLPWMKMGSQPGGLFYASHSWKLTSIEEFPSHFNDSIVAMFPDFLKDPRPLSTPNESSWTVFKAEIDRRREAGKPEINLDRQAENGDKKHEMLRTLPFQEKSLELLNNKTYTFNLSGKITTIGCLERRFPFGLNGMSTVTLKIDDNDIKVSVKYEATVLDPKTAVALASVPDPVTSEEVEVPAFSGTLDATLSKDDIDSIYYNKLRTVVFTTKDNTLRSTSQVSMAFYEDSSAPEDVSFYLTTTMPLPRWMEAATPGEYCTLNLCG